MCGILRHAKPPKDNLTKVQRKTLKELGSLEDEVILPADKGNATVMMRRDDYDTKMRGILDTATYRQLKKDPTATQEGKLSRRLKRMEKDREITEGCTTSSGRLVANCLDLGSTASQRSTSLRSLSGPLSHALGPLPSSCLNTLPPSYPA